LKPKTKTKEIKKDLKNFFIIPPKFLKS